MESNYNFIYVRERLRYLIDYNKWRQIDLAREANVTEQQISKWMNGESKRLSLENAKKISTPAKSDLAWTQYGRGEPYPVPKTETAENKGCFEARQESRAEDEKLARMERAVFKTQCPGFFNDFFDFIGENYSEDLEGVNKFLAELIKSHGNYRDWVREKKPNSDDPQTPNEGNLTANSS